MVTRGLLPLLALSAATLFIGASPASAHVNQINQGSDYAKINSNHHSGYICDQERDGDKTYISVYMHTDGTRPPFWRHIYDDGGADGTCETFCFYGCGGGWLGDTWPVRWRMCEVRSYADPCTATEDI